MSPRHIPFAPPATVFQRPQVGRGSRANLFLAPEIRPGVGELVYTGKAPTVAVSTTSGAVTAGVGAVTLIGFAPAVTTNRNVLPSVGAVTLTGFAPAVATPRNIAAGLGAASLTGFAPTVATPRNVAAGVGAYTLAGFAPTVVATANRNITPGVGAVTLTGVAPTVTASSGTAEPTPDDAGATILYDIRSSLQACTTRADMVALIQDFDSGISSSEFYLYDNAGTKWMAYTWPTGGAEDAEVAFAGVVPWSGSNSGYNNFCVTWTERWGKMSGDSSGGGTNDVLAFRTDYVNAHIKSMLILRGTSGESNDRRIYVKCFPDDISAQIDGNDYSGDGWGYDVFDGQGVDVRWTVRVRSSSSDNVDQSSGPADGTIEVWRNGTRILNSTAERIGRGAPWGLNTLATFISTTGPTTGYQRALAAWGIA